MFVVEMDRYSVCGKEFFVSDRDVTVMWPSKVAPSNPPPECIVFLTSSYSETNGRYKLQIIADSLKIKDCGVNLDLFNGRGAYGNYIVSRDKTAGSSYLGNFVIITVSFGRPLGEGDFWRLWVWVFVCLVIASFYK